MRKIELHGYKLAATPEPVGDGDFGVLLALVAEDRSELITVGMRKHHARDLAGQLELAAAAGDCDDENGGSP